MTSDKFVFHHGLSPQFLDALDALTRAEAGQWWRDVLVHPDLVIAIRREYLNVYYRGASLFLVKFRHGRIMPTTYVKYLVRRQQPYVALTDTGAFQVDPGQALWTHYAGPKTLADMVHAARDIAGPEKASLHHLIKTSPKVIDVEIAFGRAEEKPPAPEPNGSNADADETGSAEAGQGQDRLDVATLETAGSGEAIRVAFHEAKHFNNKELRARANREPPVVGQMERYRKTLIKHADAISRSYRDVCRALVRIDAMSRVAAEMTGHKPPRALDPLIARIAQEDILPEIDPEPRLVVFGFDKDQRDGPVWQGHHDRLKNEFKLAVYAVGNTRSKSSPAFR